jgi:FCD domain
MTDIEGFAAGDERFHLAIAAAADNGILAMFNQQLQAMITGTRREVFAVIEISPRAQEYHWSIYRAIERRAPAEAMAAVNGHLEEMEDYVRRTLRARPGAGDVAYDLIERHVQDPEPYRVYRSNPAKLRASSRSRKSRSAMICPWSRVSTR